MNTVSTHKPKLAFAGVGWIGRSRMKAAVESGLAEVVVITDPSDECISEAQRIAGNCKSDNVFESAINDQDVEGVVIATPSALHKEQSVAAFEQGKAVFCQKPLGRNAAEVQDVVNAAQKAGKLLGADFSYRYTNAFQKILPIIQSGELGPIFAVDLKFHNAYGPDKPWFYDRSLSGGGCVLDLGIHLIDLMLFALDFPEVTKVDSELYSKGVALTSNDTVEDFANVHLQLSTGASATLSCSWNLNAGCEAIIEATFYGAHGGVSVKNVNGSFYDFEAHRFYGIKTEVLATPPDDWGGRALLNWISKLAASDAYDEEADEFVRSAAVIDRIYAGI